MEHDSGDLGVNDIHSSDAGPADAVKSSLPIPPSLRLPADFGDYRFIERLGKGAYGEVFKVWSEGKCRYEAMKLLHEVGEPVDDRLDAFKHEVQRMANVRSPHVVHVYHVDVTPQGRPFFTMEYSNGGRLDDYCDRTRKPIDDRIRAVADICDAVQRMHELNLVHCDIKPGNIVVTEDEGVMSPKLVDFGLASHLAFRQSANRTARGTLPYMAPEQLDSRGGDPEKCWDIYALGVTLYRLIVGECPIEHFPDPTQPLSVLAEHVRRTPIPPLVEKLTSTGPQRYDEIARERRLDADTLLRRLRDPWLEAVVGKALAKPIDERYASAGEMAANLRQFAAGRRPPIVRPTSRDRVREFLRDRGLVAALAAVLTVATALAVWGYRANAASRRAEVERLFAQGCSEADPTAAAAAYEDALKLDAKRSDIRLHLAGAHAARGDGGRAFDVARAVPRGDRNYMNAQAFIHGIEQFRSGGNVVGSPTPEPIDGVEPGAAYYASLALGPDRAEQAVRLLDRALDDPALTHDARFRLRLMRAMRYLQLNDNTALEPETLWLVETVPDSAAAWNLRGIALQRRGRKDAASEAFGRSLELNPRFAAVYRNRADLSNELGRYRSALRDWENAVALAPALSPLTRDVQIRALVGLADMSAARAVCEAVGEESLVSPQTQIACGNVWMISGQAQRAWREFDGAVERAEHQSGIGAELLYAALQGRGAAASKDGRHVEAIDDLTRAARLAPDQWREDPRNSLLRGVVYLLADQPEGAIADLGEAVRLLGDDPQRSLLYLWIWDVHNTRGDHAEAAEALRGAETAARGDERLARIVAHCVGDVDRDVILKDAGGDSAKRTEALYYAGLAAKARGRIEEAIASLQACRAIDSTQVERDLAEMQMVRLRSRSEPSVKP